VASPQVAAPRGHDGQRHDEQERAPAEPAQHDRERRPPGGQQRGGERAGEAEGEAREQRDREAGCGAGASLVGAGAGVAHDR